MKKEIIIARYKEDLNYISRFNDDIKITIYNKNKEENEDRYINLPNIGRESHTFLYHIVNNYDNLADINVFLQGDPFFHCREIIDVVNTKNEYYLINGESMEEENNYKYSMVCKEVWDIFNPEYIHPESLIFSPGAQYMVTKDQILYHKKEVYKSLLDFHSLEKNLLLDYRNEHVGGIEMPWIIERYWRYIWEKIYIK